MVGVVAGDGLHALLDGPADRRAVGGEVGHGAEVGGDLHRHPAGRRLPVEQPALDVLDRDGAGVVVGLVALLLGAVVPGVAALSVLPIRTLVFRCSIVSRDIAVSPLQTGKAPEAISGA